MFGCRRPGALHHKPAEALPTCSGSRLRRRLTATLVQCEGEASATAAPATALRPAANPTLRVPNGRELERMRQFRQQQQYKQQQRMRQMQRQVLQAPPRPGAPAPQPPAPSSPRGRPQRAAAARLADRDPPLQPATKAKAPRRSPSQEPKDGLDPALFRRLVEQHGVEESWRPQVGLLAQLGLRPADFARLAEQRPEVFQTGVATMRRKLAFLRQDVGLSAADLAKIVAKFPRILEYRSEETLRPRMAFLRECGVPQADIARLVVRAPMVMELSVSDTLAPRAAFLRRELSLAEGGLGKLIARHPQVLTCTEDMMGQRIEFLRGECGLDSSEVARAVLAHPQVLHYKIDSMRQRLDYLRSVGMSAAQAGSAAARLPQLFSLNVAANLAPKWHYLVEHLGAGVAALSAYPGYLSLSLPNRIMPRHRFMQLLRGGDGPQPFPLSYLKMADGKFAVEVAGSTLAEYEEFRDRLRRKAEAAMVAGDEEAAVSSDDDRSSDDDDVADDGDDGAWGARLLHQQQLQQRQASMLQAGVRVGGVNGIINGSGLYGGQGGGGPRGIGLGGVPLRQLPVARSSPE